MPYIVQLKALCQPKSARTALVEPIPVYKQGTRYGYIGKRAQLNYTVIPSWDLHCKLNNQEVFPCVKITRDESCTIQQNPKDHPFSYYITLLLLFSQSCAVLVLLHTFCKLVIREINDLFSCYYQQVPSLPSAFYFYFLEVD